ncbi:MAG TPA: prenyltransferase/squalene oxidase repeat-containing protein [Verrucomicrobiae bacterium]|nr:prenyltransferase/squalene oxidase repeat-containing protein [Verrucomicrobiae bacterium]
MTRLSQETQALLLSLRNGETSWSGKLSASALSTATAVMALVWAAKVSQGNAEQVEDLVDQGLAWLAAHPNADGAWGDTVLSRSNLSTTSLVWASFAACPRRAKRYQEATQGAELWLKRHIGGVSPENLAREILQRYESDRTFSVPILTHCVLGGCMGSGPGAWSHVIPLPFELAVFPKAWFAALQLPVVSYALPALIAMGYARHFHAPSRNPLVARLRSLAASRAFRVLDSLQPANGGFLEAIPLTSFVTMCLLATDQAHHAVARRGLNFIIRSVQADGSWQIDTNLATWGTTLAVNALASSGALPLSEAEKLALCDWLLGQQYQRRHPYTDAAPGGWAWTNLPGGVPDADDTAGALLALRELGVRPDMAREAAAKGVEWLLGLQNRDGGIPTFCRGWGKLPFDRSSADLTAHALRAWTAWKHELPARLQRQVGAAIRRSLQFLDRTQEASGAWCPLWFGNEHEADEANRVYGTSRVVIALAEAEVATEAAKKGVDWLLRAQKPDGSWSGGEAPAPGTVEETALATEALSAALERWRELELEITPAIRRGIAWLSRQVDAGTWRKPAPIGFYFAKLWYFEELYPVVFTVAALNRASRVLKD